MIYTLFLYHSESGLPLLDINLQDISSGKMDLFASFFSALKSFISEIVLDGSKELKNIELGDYRVLITNLDEIKADLVIIGDKEDSKAISKIIPKIIKIISNYQEVFLEWKGAPRDFNELKQEISELVLSQRKLVGKISMIENSEIVLNSMWSHKPDISNSEKESLISEKQSLIAEFEACSNIVQKLAMSETLLKISEDLKNSKGFVIYQEQIKSLKDEIRDTKIKLNYYLERTKVTISLAVDSLGPRSLNEGDYKDVYLN
ncbi:MAG: hypothetical protein ACTSPS_03060, partial [Promethearchaeota archaeon]